MSDEFLVYSYQFNFPDKQSIELNYKIDSLTTTLESNTDVELPFWAELDYKQCVNCSLKVKDHVFCPVAKNLIPLIKACDSLVSYQTVDVIITTPERTISANTTMQRAMSSILGLIMATSPCPHTEYLKPMARFHLPLATEEETIYRTTSMYLLAQYFRHKEKMDFELALEGLTAIYDNLTIINKALASRFRTAIKEDATVNAIIILDLLSQAVSWSIEDELEELRPLFNRFLI